MTSHSPQRGLPAEPSAGLQQLQADGLDLAALAEDTTVEMLVWHAVPGTHKPDAEATVLLALADGELWQGYWDDAAQVWCGVDAFPIAAQVCAWSEPLGPADHFPGARKKV